MAPSPTDLTVMSDRELKELRLAIIREMITRLTVQTLVQR
jgi:hypothetical protein